MSEINIILPPCSQDEVSDGLRRLTRALGKMGAELSGGILGGSDGYGAHWSSSEFVMHPYCWCEREECPWCVGCDCDTAYILDGKDVYFGVWVAAYEDAVMGLKPGTKAHNNAGGAANRRRGERVVRRCEFCRSGTFAAAHGGGPGKAAPNFRHLPTGFRVWWYKYIGRGMEIDAPSGVEWADVLARSIDSLRTN